jgi:hypothetical protein
MFGRRIGQYNLLGGILLGLALFCTLPVAGGGEQTPSVGTLRIKGQGIERFVLQGETGPQMVYYHREPNLVLAAGSYRLEEVVLQGEYSSSGLQIPAEARELRIEPGGLVTLKLGAPLRQTVRVERWGRSLVLNYQLFGQGGESYAVTRRQATKPPAFVIYQGENKIVSGNFVPT